MRSRAHFQGHPIHPMLVAFPIRSSTARWPSNLAGGSRMAKRVDHRRLPGPRRESRRGWSRGAGDHRLLSSSPEQLGQGQGHQHMIVNVSSLTAFAIAWAIRGNAHVGAGNFDVHARGSRRRAGHLGGLMGGISPTGIRSGSITATARGRQVARAVGRGPAGRAGGGREGRELGSIR